MHLFDYSVSTPRDFLRFTFQGDDEQSVARPKLPKFRTTSFIFRSPHVADAVKAN
jgi:hypothetical protein